VLFALIGCMFVGMFWFMGGLVLDEARKMRGADHAK
jgi:hypothetical protein